MMDISIYDFTLRLVDLSKTGIIIILGVILVRYFIRKAPKKYSYFLWIIVAIRLLCPFSIESIFSIFNVEKIITPIVENETIISEVITYTQPLYYENRIHEYLNANLGPEAYPIEGYLPNYFYVWIVGIMLILVYTITSYSIVYNQVKYAIHLEENVYECENIKSPFIFGIFKPKIYIPYHLDNQTKEIVLRHEQFHIHRKDYLLRILALCIAFLYWFNPFVWLSYHLFIQDMEMSCDEHVLLQSDNKTYSSTLLNMATEQHAGLPKPLAFGEKSISKRIKNILKWKEPKKIIQTISMILCFVVFVTLISNPTKQDNLFDLLKKYDIETIDTLRLQLPGIDNHDVTFTNWIHTQIFDEQFDIIQVSKLETKPTDESIDVVMTFTDGENEVKFLFPTSYDICIVETDDTRTAYRILNHDVAKNELRYTHDRVNFWAEGPNLEHVQVFASYISINQAFTSNDVSFDTRGYICIIIIDGENYTIDTDYVVGKDDVTFISRENDDVLVFDIQVKGYEKILIFNESKSNVESKEIIEILNQLQFTTEFSNRIIE